MLNFFKKTGRSLSGEAAAAVTSVQTAATTSSSSPSDVDDILLDAEKFCAENAPLVTATLVDDKPIVHIVTNPNALSHLVQFLDTRPDGGAALALLKFWLDADSFQTAAAAEHQPAALSKSQSLDDTALRRPLTDDEKSHARRSERRRFQTTLATDAVRIFRKYLTAKCAHPVDVPATVLARISLALGAGRMSADVADDDDAAAVEDSGDTVRTKHPSATSHDSGVDETDDCCTALRRTTGATTSAGTAQLGTIFRAAQRHALATLERDHLDAFVESPFYARHCIDVLTGDALRIEDILNCQSALFYLAEFLEQDGHRRLLEFWVAAVNFRQQIAGVVADKEDQDEEDDGPEKHATDDDDDFEDDDDDDEVGGSNVVEQAQADALVLYDRYFSLQAPAAHRLGVSDARRTQVEQSICTRSVPVLARCFDESRRIVERHLGQQYFRAFVTSPLFGRYLAELLHKIDGPAASKASLAPRASAPNAGSTVNGAVSAQASAGPRTANTSRHRKSASECIRRTTPISAQNTLLAMDTMRPAAATSSTKALTASCMQIDGRQLSDPEALWKRSNSAVLGTGLCFGRVNAMGRYERNFEVHAPTTAAASATGAELGGHNAGDGRVAGAQHSNGGNASTLMKAVRRLVRLPEDRAKEDLAWEVAEMIVRDITNVTLRGGVGE